MKNPFVRTLALFALLAPGAHGQLELPDEKVKEEASAPSKSPERRGDLSEKALGKGRAKRSGGGLVLPRQPLATPESAQPPAPVATLPVPAFGAAPAADAVTGSAAEFVLVEVAKVDDLSHRIVAHGERSLLALGDSGRDAARRALYEDHAPLMLVGARVLLQSGFPEDAELVTRRLRDRMPRPACVPLVDAVVELDPVRGSPGFLAELLCHPQANVRAVAQRHLEEQSTPAMLSALLVPLDAKLMDSRLRAVQLVAGVRDPAVLPLLLGRLDDRSSTVAVRAVTSLASLEDARVEDELLRRAFGMRWILREGAYALLTLVEREDRRVVAILEDTHVPQLLEGLDSSDPFVAGTCATALAGVGFRSAGGATAWLDRSVPHRLVRVVAGEDFHNDYSALQPIALRRLSLISGEHFGSNGPAWMTWWSNAAPLFAARRAVINSTIDDAGSLRLALRTSVGAPDAFLLLGPDAAAQPAPEGALQVESVFLSEARSRELFAQLEAEGVFGSERLPGTRGDAVGGARVLDITVAGRGKQFRFGAAASEEWFERIAASAGALRDENRWQRYLPVSADAERSVRLASWGEEITWWETASSELERDRRLKSMVLASLAAVRPSERDRPAAELARLAAKPEVIEAVDFSTVLGLIGDEWFVGLRARAFIQVALAAARRASIDGELPEPQLTRDLIDRLVAHFGAEAAAEVSGVLDAAGSELTRAAAGDERPFLRAVAAATLAREPDATDLAVLMKLLDDPIENVEVAAVLALGENEVEAARTELLVRARVGTLPVRLAALEAVGRLGGEGAFDALLVGLAERDHPGVVVAAAHGLAELGDPQAAPLLISLLAKGREGDVFEPARDGLLGLGEEGWSDLLRVVHSPAHRARRDAALILARQGVAQVTSALMSILTDDPTDARVAEELAILTCVDFSEAADPAVAWWSWWDLVVHDDSLAWLRGELERLGVDAPPAEALAGAGTREGALFLLEVMRRDEPHLVERGRRELERLLETELAEAPPLGSRRDVWFADLREAVDRHYE
jgi:HEAT repeat protein